MFVDIYSSVNEKQTKENLLTFNIYNKTADQRNAVNQCENFIKNLFYETVDFFTRNKNSNEC